MSADFLTGKTVSYMNGAYFVVHVVFADSCEDVLDTYAVKDRDGNTVYSTHDLVRAEEVADELDMMEEQDEQAEEAGEC